MASSSPPHIPLPHIPLPRKRPALCCRLRSFPLFFLLAAFLALTGCATGPKEDPVAKYRTNMEEMMSEPYTPRDDGLPLTPAELHAFKTVGDLDRDLSAEDANTVELHFKYFVHQKRDSFTRFLERTARFLPYIKKVFHERGIPADIAYLAMVESGGNPNAISPAGAAGLWQFMPFTGKKFGLRQDNWMDERRDPYKATYAASDYLLKLYNDFSEWKLAVAAYNAGEGKIGRAVNGTGATDFFDLCRLDCQLEESARLRTETRDYVPRLLAIAKIMRNLKRLGFSEPTPGMAWNLNPVTVLPGVNLSGLARQLGLTWDEFSGMNPAFRRTASPPTRESTAYVPPDKMADAVRWLAGNEARVYAGWKEYRVKKGDSLASIARRHKIKAAAIREANGFSSLPRAGSVILLPGGGKADPVYAALPETASSPSASAGAYTIRSGDTLFSLAQQWGSDVESIRLANRMGRGDVLKPGQRVSIPGNSKNRPVSASPARGAPVGQTAMPRGIYTVRPGDTLGGIAGACGVSVAALREANRLDSKTSAIRAGQKLTIPARPGAADRSASGRIDAGSAGTRPARRDAEKPATARAKGGKVTVKAGDTLHSIARSNKVSLRALQQANRLGDHARIRPGQSLVLP